MIISLISMLFSARYSSEGVNWFPFIIFAILETIIYIKFI